VKDEHAGKLLKCPKCKSAITVSGNHENAVEQAPPHAGTSAAKVATTTARSASPPDSDQIVREANQQPTASRPLMTQSERRAVIQRELLAAFQGDIPRVRVSVLYRCGIALSAIMMVMLPLVYVAMIGLTAFGVYYHAAHDDGMLNAREGAPILMVGLLYAGPIVAGVILVFFMLKPLFAPPAIGGRRRSFTRQGEPVLFALVDRVCQAVGARAPTRIDVDWQLNASASFAEGWFGLFGDRLVLTIGSPLIAGLDAGQFAGVLAHEFGHFTQGGARRLTFLVRSINRWLVRIVYQRDAWDQWLAESANGLNFRIGWILQLSRFCVYASRCILWGLMMIGHMVSSFLLRQMEFHADAYEAGLVGSAVFEDTSRRMESLSVAYQATFQELNRLVMRRCLPDDLPRLILATYGQFSTPVLQLIDQQISTAKTGWLDTHPSSAARIRRAQQESAAPRFVNHRPATELFSDFQALARNTTGDLYRAYFGTRFQPSAMRPMSEVLAEAEPPQPESLPPLRLD
jgi:Zn-dependent protease with chaperone function